jgi:hypothetical protein
MAVPRTDARAVKFDQCREVLANELTSINVEPTTIIDAGKVGKHRQGSLKFRFDLAE